MSPLVVLGMRKVLLAVGAMGGRASNAWRSVLDDLIDGGLCSPHLRIPAANDGVRDHIRSAVPLRHKHVFDIHVLA